MSQKEYFYYTFPKCSAPNIIAGFNSIICHNGSEVGNFSIKLKQI